MPPRDKISQLPAEIRSQIDQILIASGFGGYEELEQTILDEHGVKVGKSTLHRYGQKLERRIAAIKASTEAAQAIAEAAPDDADQRSAAVISLVQSEMFDVLLDLQEAEDEALDPAERVKLLSRAARAIAQIGRASVGQKKWEAEIRAQVMQAAADTAAQTASKAGVSDDTVEAIRRDVLKMGG